MRFKEKNKQYVARDHNGDLHLHMSKPKKQGWVWQSEVFILLDKNEFPKVEWENGMVEVEIIKKKISSRY